jgi:hypothetical protein
LRRFEKKFKQNIAVYLNDSDVLVTFRFVTQLSKWPDFVANFKGFGSFRWPHQNKAEFQKASKMNFTTPAVIFLNSGPWEYYSHNQAASKSLQNSSNVEKYKRDFTSFLRHNFGINDGTMPSTTTMVVLGNTACPSDPKCEGSGKISCFDAMAQVDDVQRTAMADAEMPRVRYVDSGALFQRLPTGYSCLGSGYHLPGLMTEARLNLALSAFI